MKEKIFYRYVPLKKRVNGKVVDKLGKLRTLKILKNNMFYFSYPYEFNDPFDGRQFCHFEGNKDEWRAHYNKEKDEIKRKQSLDLMESINYDPKRIDEMYKFVNNDNRYHYIVYCLSELNDSILMWTHYASQHSGLCLGFKSTNEDGKYYLDMEEKVNLFNPTHKALLSKVQYQDSYPNIVNPVKNKNYSYESFQLAKSQSWEYEKEYRVLIHSKSFNCYKNKYKKRSFKFKREILSEVIFGIRMEYAEMKEISDIVTDIYINQGIDVKLYKAKMNEYNYGINFEPFEAKNPLKFRWNL